jgi:hypothetical protein
MKRQEAIRLTKTWKAGQMEKGGYREFDQVKWNPAKQRVAGLTEIKRKAQHSAREALGKAITGTEAEARAGRAAEVRIGWVVGLPGRLIYRQTVMRCRTDIKSAGTRLDSEQEGMGWKRREMMKWRDGKGGWRMMEEVAREMGDGKEKKQG